MKNKHYRQGDVLLERISKMPSDLKKLAREDKKIILAHGEVTGHAHAIIEENCDLFSSETEAGVTFLEVREAMAALTHEEHGRIDLAPGNYRVRRQREYSPQAIRNVAD